jgi:hypothetical protein
MIEIQDDNGRLIVVLPILRRYNVFLDGKCKAEFRRFGDAMSFAKTLAGYDASMPLTQIPGVKAYR